MCTDHRQCEVCGGALVTALVPEPRARCKYPAKCTYHGLVYILGSTASCVSPGLMFTKAVQTNRSRDETRLPVHCVARGAAKRCVESPGRALRYTKESRPRPRHGQGAALRTAKGGRASRLPPPHSSCQVSYFYTITL